MADLREKLRLGVSSCLLGQKVRYDGEHKRDAFLVEQLGPFVEWVSVCPELELGMGVPREPVQLVRQGAPGTPLLMMGNRSGEDWTGRMTAFAEHRVKALPALSGYVLKSRSPSCGLARVKVYDAQNPQAAPSRDGMGLFARALRARFPALPIEEEARLGDPRARENFVERLFAYDRLRRLLTGRFSLAALLAFHQDHELALRAHSPTGQRELGRLLAGAAGLSRAELRARYQSLFMSTLSKIATPDRHGRILRDLFRQLQDRLDAGDRAELLTLIEDHRKGVLPLLGPLTLLRHQVRRLGMPHLQRQVYLQPHPLELTLRNRL